MSTQTFRVTGMTCDHCVHAVTEEVSALDGVEAVTIELVAGGASSVLVTSASPMSAEVMRAAVDEAGYELVE
ncbi:MAG: heavy-metal-associated domain-containing protein [Candidatus Nanopelagicales bacterium]|nr:heavy-metal-associated domain-containing protein [Candidatus Nanopelagicales bacterium]MCF8537643.1 heavy-metal-associated domain-containing protein [Candidatus Nanopelagicales bacterium]MCF8542264.1 heavy-metal-associated domain-containing protein [Candidatus Nanopelagicales bacterium]MCF8558041.1 heavy-metal-associated domain-containing protein [Candidatus Nanopelagicales bacterium]